MKRPKNLTWFGPVYSYSGYAVHNRSMIFELVKLGWNIKLFPSEDTIPKHLIGKDLLLNLVDNPTVDRKNSLSLNLVPPPALPLYGPYTILFTTLESLTVHEGFMKRCSLFDEVWFPCKFNITSMKKAGYKKSSLYYCPEGVYSHFWTPHVTPHPRYKSKSFTFFYNGDWSYRKGIDILIRAYAKAFLPTDPVRLLMLAHYQGHGKDVSRQHISSELMEMCQQYGITRLPPIEFIYAHIDDPDMPAVYNCANCYVSPTRGEAWGLPIIQAMSCGIPAIIPKWGGHTDYCTPSNSFMCDIDPFDTMDDKVYLTVDFYKYQKFCFPNVDHFAKLMRTAYEKPSLTLNKGRLARKHVVDNFSWSNSGKIADARLTKLNETRLR